MSNQTCALCSRDVPYTTEHHLVPKTRHKNKKTRKTFSRSVLQTTVALCEACHRQIHRLIDEKTLEREYNTIERIKSHKDIRTYLNWIVNKPPAFKPKP